MRASGSPEGNVIIPLAAAPEALDGYVQVTANLQRSRDALDLPITIVAVVPTRFDHRLFIHFVNSHLADRRRWHPAVKQSPSSH
jgi:hypothetical protein